MSQTPPRLLMALALVGATAVIQLSVLMAMVSLPGGGVVSGTTLGPLVRIQYGSRLLDVGVLLLVPLAVLLARLDEPSAASPAQVATRTVLIGASAVGAASAFLLTLRLVADLGGDPRLLAQTVAGTLVHDLGLLSVAVAGAFWAYRELQRTPPTPTDTEPAAEPATPPSDRSAPTGFPSGPPLAPPPPPEQPS
jgi:hypothetical protein